MSSIIHTTKNCSYLLSGYLTPVQYSVFSIIFLAIFTYMFVHSFGLNMSRKVGLTLIIAGAASIIYERLTEGCVTDYINFIGLFYFNVYDLMITTGTAVLSYSVITNKKMSPGQSAAGS